MPAPPPPPPPGPPPPSASRSAGGDDGRSMLLQSIRKGTTLKKTVTVDRSAPLLSGKVCGADSRGTSGGSSSSTSQSSNSNSGSKVSSSGAGSNGLGGLFSDGIPKLRPTGRTLGDGTSGPGRTHHQPSTSGPQRSESASRKQFSGEFRNRGPPPQPPPANQKPTISTSASDSVLTGGPRQDGLNVSGSHNHLVGSASPPTLPSKPPVINHGKPNLAPKPPGMAPGRPSPPPKKLSVNGSGRASVTRAQSMRVPRSPPVAPPSGPIFPANKELGKGPMAFHQSQDSLHYRTNPPPPPRTNTLPSNLNHHGGLKAVAPLPPPNAPPPPAPSNRPLRPPVTRPPPPPWRGGSTLTPPVCPPPPPPPSMAPPPPPHHRSSPAPPPPPSALQTRLAPAVPSCAPPLPPTRNSSMRNGPAQSAIADFEERFGQYFHRVEEFPPPQPHRKVVKVYNSKNARHAPPQPAKQPAPQPPMLQLGRGWHGDVSNC